MGPCPPEPLPHAGLGRIVSPPVTGRPRRCGQDGGMGDTTGPVSWRLPALIAFCAALLLALLLSQPDGVIAQDRGGSLEAGRVYAWGANSEGQTGLGVSTDQNVITPQLSQHLENATQIAAGD